MKNILTVVFVIVLGVFAQAKNTPSEIKVEAIAKTIIITEELNENLTEENTLEVARLYRRSPRFITVVFCIFFNTITPASDIDNWW